MELLKETNDAKGVSLSNGFESTLSENSLASKETQDESKKEQAMIPHDQDSLNTRNPDTAQAAMTEEKVLDAGIGGSKVDTTMKEDEHIPAVTPPSVEDGVQPPQATLDETVATNVESPSSRKPTDQASSEPTVDASGDFLGAGQPQSETDHRNEPASLSAETMSNLPHQESSSNPPTTSSAESTNNIAKVDENASNSIESMVHQTQQTETEGVLGSIETVDDNAKPGETSSELVTEDDQQQAFDMSRAFSSIQSVDDEPPHPDTTAMVDGVQSSEGDTQLLQEQVEYYGDQQMTASDGTEPTIASMGDSQNETVVQPMPMDTDVVSQGVAVPSANIGIEPNDVGPQAAEASSDQPEVVAEADAKPAAVAPPASVEVIDLLDSDDDEDSSPSGMQQNGPPAAKRQRMEGPPLSAGASAATYQSAVARMPGPAIPQNHALSLQQQQLLHAARQPFYVDPVPGFVPTWKDMVPKQTTPRPPAQNKWKSYELTLLNVSEFTITGTRVGDEYTGYITSIAGLRAPIKKISKGHGNAFFERDPEGGTGKWHIPLGAYHAFYGFLRSDPFCRVEGISESQLKIASLGKARLEKDYPSAQKLARFGVPKQLADALAPFQRGGVDFVIEKEGRALIADEMGLGKTIQAIASMAVYHEEWPLLVLCPSSARYHWENEFRHWLGKNSSINESEHAGAFDAEVEESKSEDEADDAHESRPAMPLLHESQINVLTSGQDKIFPHESTKVVICSYGLAPNLVTNEKLVPGMFKCAIVDESHMLKNKATQRTLKLLPVLKSTNRCVLLSGTPAFARPLELWPQLQILGTERHGWWQDEKEYIRKYSRGGTQRRAELHTMLMGTVMIRRMKNDILKTLPVKVREQGILDVMDASTRREMKECMVTLRTGKGKLCELARGHKTDEGPTETPADTDESSGHQESNGDHHGATNGAPVAAQDHSAAAVASQTAAAVEQLRQLIDQKRAQGHDDIRQTVANYQHQMDPLTVQNFVRQMETKLEGELSTLYQHQMQQISAGITSGAGIPLSIAAPQPEPPSAKKAVLNHMYSLTGKCKIPFVVDMLKRWLEDPTRGKLCIFAHHISCLDEIGAGAGLSNALDSTTKYIRIDGSTTPRARQEQINRFQRDSSVRIALLGITAAGVAVTLTASSTVWFAELFWTPAIMIQAEDRCHRIGQQAQVKCLYFVAKGTLDELLWKLLENKFESLGEFVEGKEKMKMVVNKTYHSTHELLKTVAPDDALDSEGELSDLLESELDVSNVQEIDSDLEHEIEELGKEEEQILKAAADNDGSDPESDAKPAARVEKKDTVGTTEDEAICLSDDDDDEVEVVPVAPAVPQAEKSADGEVEATSEEIVPAAKKPLNILTASFPGLRLYRLLFIGARYGLNFALIEGRMVVSGQNDARMQEFGPQARPHVGDVLVQLGTYIVPLTPLASDMSRIVNALRNAKNLGQNVQLTFAEDSTITDYAKEVLAEREKDQRDAQVRSAVAAAQNATGQINAAPPSANEIIEID